MPDTKLKVAILVVSETASKDAASDKCIPTLTEVFGTLGSDQWEIAATEIVPDSVLDIQKHVRMWSDSEVYMNLIVTSGGTGFATKDVTPEVWIKHPNRTSIKLTVAKAVTPLLDRQAPGLV
jgi:gephyrin